MMIRRLFSALLPILCCFPAAGAGEEPSADLARRWWPEQYNVWTPVSWPDHYFKFTVFYNGMVIASPATQGWRPHSQKWAGRDLQLSFRASADGGPWAMPQAVNYILREWDGGLGVQHWQDGHAAPVLQTEFRSKDGIVMETSFFAHTEGGKVVVSALEPEYGRLRVKVKHVDRQYHPDTYYMSVMLSRVFLSHCDFGKLAPDILVTPASAPGLPAFSLQAAEDGRSYRLTEPDGGIRMEIRPGAGQTVTLSEIAPGQYNLCLGFAADEGSFVDLTVPMLATAPTDFQRASDLSYEDALAEADRFWESRVPASAATFDVPERELCAAVKSNIDFVPVIAEKDYKNGSYGYMSGTWGYDALWPTPGSFVGVMLDYLGYGAEVDKYDAVFARTQGTVTPPGPAYRQHPGYLGSPRHLQSIDWLTDHGAILWQVAMHGLLTGDADFIARWTEPIVKACDFIVDMSRSEHDGVAGLLPAGWATDEATPQQAVWIEGWNYRGMYDAVRLLRRIGHPRAEGFEAFLKEFRETFLREYRKTVEAGPRWTDASGAERFKPSTTLSNEHGVHTFMSDAFYLDTGPLCLVFAGLMDADDPVMRDVAAFFREGPNWALRKPFPWSCDRPVLEHEISSCEPCYSFNAFHSWQLGDRQRYLEAMYSILIGAVSQNTYISCEHRHGMQGTQFAFPLGFMLARLAVIDDRISEGDLHLLRFCPLAWLTPERPARFLRMPTEFGPVDLTAQLSRDGKTLEVGFSVDWREKPGEVVLHVPPVPGLKRVRINGRLYPASRGTIPVRL